MLMTAVKNNDMELTKALLSAKNIDVTIYRHFMKKKEWEMVIYGCNETALDIALKNRYFDIANLIIEKSQRRSLYLTLFKNKKYNRYSYDSYDCLEDYWDYNYYMEEITKYKNVLNLFLFHPRFKIPITKSLIEAIVKNNNIEGIKTLMKNKDINGSDITCDEIKDLALTAAAEHNCVDVIKYFIEKGVQVYSNKLVIAASNGQTEIVKFLIKNGIGVDVINEALISAVRRKKVSTVEYLRDKADSNTKKEALDIICSTCNYYYYSYNRKMVSLLRTNKEKRRQKQEQSNLYEIFDSDSD